MLRVGDYVKVIDQDIKGMIVETWGNKAVIEDDDSEYCFPESRLEFKIAELILWGEKNV